MRNIVRNKVSTIILLLIINNTVFSQNNFFKLTFPEQKWVILHPFISKKAQKISIEAIKETKKLLNDSALDGDINGGQLDAFRHAYWMARLVQEINPRKAKLLGKAHEKGNKIYFKKHRTEEGTVPDMISCKMDMLNNEKGIEIGLNNIKLEPCKLITLIKNKILKGELWIIKKDKNGNFLDINNKIINMEIYKGKWDNPKCLTKSNQAHNAL